MPTHPGHPAIASTTLVSASRSLLNDAFDSVSIQTLTASATVDPDLGRYILVAPADHMTITLPDPSSDERYQNVRLVLKRTTAGTGAVSVVVAGGGTIDGASSTTLNAQYDCEVLFSDTTAGVWHRLRDASNLLAPDYLDFGDWIVGTDDSNPAPTATSDQYVAPDGTTTADKIEWDNSTELADESWAEPGAASIEAGDTAQYSFYIDSEVGDGVKTVLEVGDSSVPQITEQATVAFSNVFAEDLIYPDYTSEGPSGGVASTIVAPDGSLTAIDNQAVSNQIYLRNLISVANYQGREFTVTRYVYSYSLATGSATNYTLNLKNDTTGGTSISAVFQDGADGWYVSSLSATSAGPALTTENATRSDRIAGTNWFKLSIRVRDYAGTGNRSQLYFRILGTDGRLFTYWNQELRYGNHITGQQLLTVDDGVENLLTTDAGAPADYTDFGNYAYGGGVPVITTSAIAAPDGTLTATHITGTSQLTGMVSTPSDGNWLDDASWTARIYFYYPSMLSGQLYRTWIRSEAAGGSTALEQSFVQLGTTGSTPSIAAYSGTTSGSEPYSQEKNVDLKAIGNTGWYRLDLSINAANSPASAEIVYVPLQGNSSLAEFVFWNPTLRYGDWVSRGKNWHPTTDLTAWELSSAPTSLSRSATPAPDGTLSAYDLSRDDSSTAYVRARSQILESSGGAYTLEFWVNHSSAVWDSARIFFYLQSSTANTEQVWLYLNTAGGASSLVSYLTSGPGYTLADHVQQDAIGQNGWWRYRITLTDYSNNAAKFESYWYLQDTATSAARSTIWNPRLTVGNPADARGYFVSGPQNLLGDGSDYDPATSGWATVGSSPPTVTTNTHVAPNGRLEADTIALPAGNFTALHRYSLNGQLPAGVAGASREYQFYIKRDASTPNPQFLFSWFMYDSSFAVIERLQFIMQLNGPTISSLSAVTTGGPGYTVDDIELTNVSNDWVRLRMRLTDYSGTCNGQGFIQHYNYSTSNPADLVLWGSEMTTIDRTPTATDLRPISGGIVNYDAYPAEHRSLFASYEDAGDNWYKVTMNLTEPN